jgi:G3E family GTPase
MDRVQFLMIGGFLGAGKTTAIARLARHYIDQGLRVGLVTNDQAYDLVDTHTLRQQGFDVGEVPGACFCCKFEDLVETVVGLSRDETPEVIIAEPVGSCTDLAATVLEPLRHLYGDRFETGPLAVLLKPEHGQKILRQQQGVGFSPKAAYIFLKQLEEADIVVLNKIDKLDDEESRQLIRLIESRFPGKQVIACSARRGDGFEQLVEELARPAGQRHGPMEVDYDIYAEGEAELGWLNATFRVEGSGLELDSIALALVDALARALRQNNAEPAHLKVLAQTGSSWSVANLVGSSAEPELSHTSGDTVSALDLIVNARVAIDPDRLAELVTLAVEQVTAPLSVTLTLSRQQSFRPGRPVPTHRFGTP